MGQEWGLSEHPTFCCCLLQLANCASSASLPCRKLLPPRTKHCKSVPVTCPSAHTDTKPEPNLHFLCFPTPHILLQPVSALLLVLLHPIDFTKTGHAQHLSFTFPPLLSLLCSKEMQHSRVQPWPQLPRTSNFPGLLQFGINHLPAQIPSLWVSRPHKDLHQKLLPQPRGLWISKSNTQLHSHSPLGPQHADG